jgi:hypothetical protein
VKEALAVLEDSAEDEQEFPWLPVQQLGLLWFLQCGEQQPHQHQHQGKQW